MTEMDYDDNMILVYFLRAPPWNETINHTLSTASDDASPEIHYYRAILAFLVCIMLYFCLVCHAWKDESPDAKPAVIDKSLVRKKVLPHGQSQHFSERENNEVSDEERTKSRLVCCCRKQTNTLAPSAETAEEILDKYKLKTYRELRRQAVERRHPNDNANASNHDDELVLAEEGLATPGTDILCPVCLEPFHIGEEVCWSKLQHCRHVFHYQCILPWAVLGHVRCPVCREIFWSRYLGGPECSLCEVIKTITAGQKEDEQSIMEISRFCVIHGLTSPSEVHEEPA